MSLKTNLRVGLFQFILGTLSLLNYGLLNRVMVVELSIPLAATSFIVSAHYFAAPVSLLVGHLSDRRSHLGYRRTPYILAGAALTVVLTAGSPSLVLYIARQGTSLATTLLGAGYFLAMGAGIYVAATAYIALITDLTDEGERGKVISVIWTMMMVGILVGAGLTATTMASYDEGRLSAIFIGTGVAVALLTAATLLRTEKRLAQGGEVPRRSDQAGAHFRQALGIVTANLQARRFFTFLTVAAFFFFAQEVVLEPFGGQIFGLEVRETTLFNAYQMAGVLVAMLASGQFLVKRWGKRRTIALGTATGVVAFLVLALSAARQLENLVRPAILLQGLGLGLFTVGGISLMMDMSTAKRAGLFMGAWSLAQALARGLSGVFGGVARDAALALGMSLPVSFAAVFALEAVGLLATLGILRGVSVREFRGRALELEHTLQALD